MSFCNACCCCTQTKPDNVTETFPGNNISSNRSFESENKIDPVLRIDAETKTNHEPISIQPKITTVTRGTSPISPTKGIEFISSEVYETTSNQQKSENELSNNVSSFDKSNMALPPENIKYPKIIEQNKLNSTNPDIISAETYKYLRLSCLEIHNKLRAQHGCPILRESDELNKIAEEMAFKIFQNNFINLEGQHKNFDHNYLWTTIPNAHVTTAVQAWYDNGMKLYDFDNPKWSKHYTSFVQLLWKSTMELGTAIIKKEENLLLICYYSPYGNIDDQFNEYTIPRPITNFVVTNEYIKKNIKYIRQSALNYHNQLRALHGCSQLLENNKLDKLAEEILDFCEAGGDINSIPYEKTEGLSSNSSRCDYELGTVTLAIKNWYDGGKTFDYETFDRADELKEKCFMRIIDRDTISVGTDIRKINGEIWVYCLYLPTRNFNKIYWKYLIPRPISHNMYKPLEMYPEDMRWSCLETHNRLRDLHGCPPLKCNPELDKCAEEWAKHLAETNQLYHRPNNKYGENLYWTGDEYGHVAKATQEWYNEIDLWDFDNPVVTNETGHFSQLIWKDSMELGTGVARNETGVYVVCVYDPPGNILDRINNYYIPRPISKQIT